MPSADHFSLAENLEDILGIQRFREDRRAIADKIRPQDNGQWDWKRLDAVVAEIRKFHIGTDDSWDAHDARFKVALRGIPPERVDRLALYFPEDTVNVRFRDAGSNNNWQSLTQGSPGQQTAALLAFVLGVWQRTHHSGINPRMTWTARLFTSCWSNRFRGMKSMRQMIIVTHNPNIVVHGDAEYVVSLNVNGRSDAGRVPRRLQGRPFGTRYAG